MTPGAPDSPVRIGVISDTHGDYPEIVFELFAGVDHIIHAGDIGGEHILYDLEAIAPVTAVRGNTDHQGATWPLPQTAVLEAAGVQVMVTHIGDRGSVRVPPEVAVVVTGHTHRPEALLVGGVLHLNPGSAMRSRTSDGCGTVAVLTIRHGVPQAEILRVVPE